MLTDSDIEIRPFYEMEDFAEIATPEVEEQWERLQQEAKEKHGG